MPMMKALREFTYGQQKRRAGDLFDVRLEQHVMALVTAKLAEVDTDSPAVHERYEAKDVTADGPPKRRGRPKGTYKRHDLVAE